HIERGDRDPAYLDRPGGRQFADLGAHLDADAVARQYGRHEIEPHAERLELNRDGRCPAGGRSLWGRDRELAAGQKAGDLTRFGGQVRLRQDRDDAFFGQRVDQGVDVLRVEGAKEPTR